MITNGTSQGSPFLPILSVLYTASMLGLAESWTHKDLMLYVDNGAIYATSTTTHATTQSAVDGFAMVLNWLTQNGLEIDASKTELMMFTKTCSNTNLIGHHPHGTKYIAPTPEPNRIMAVTHLYYLGVYLDRNLDWKCHVSIMTNCACSTI